MDHFEQVIVDFLKTPQEGGAYTDKKLAALLAHAEDGKLSFWSCCCVAGIPSATHALESKNSHEPNHHWKEPKWADREYEASRAFGFLGDSDAERRERLIPLVKAEMQRRESLRTATPEVVVC